MKLRMEKNLDRKMERWNKIAMEACQQSNRNDIAEVMEPIRLKEIDKYSRDLDLVAWEKEDARRLKDEGSND